MGAGGSAILIMFKWFRKRYIAVVGFLPKKPVENCSYLVEHGCGAGGSNFDVMCYMRQYDGAFVWLGNGFKITREHIKAIYQLPDARE